MSSNLNNRIINLKSLVHELEAMIAEPKYKTALMKYRPNVCGILEEITQVLKNDVTPDIQVLDHLSIQANVIWNRARQLVSSNLEQTHTVLNDYLSALTESRRKKLATSPGAFPGDVILLNLEIDRIQKILINIKANAYIQFELDVIAQLTKLINEEV